MSNTSITMVQATSMIIIFGSEKLCEAGTRALADTARGGPKAKHSLSFNPRSAEKIFRGVQSAMKTAQAAMAPLPKTPSKSWK
jgi:hypothetical protein